MKQINKPPEGSFERSNTFDIACPRQAISIASRRLNYSYRDDAILPRRRIFYMYTHTHISSPHYLKAIRVACCWGGGGRKESVYSLHCHVSVLMEMNVGSQPLRSVATKGDGVTFSPKRFISRLHPSLHRRLYGMDRKLDWSPAPPRRFKWFACGCDLFLCSDGKKKGGGGVALREKCETTCIAYDLQRHIVALQRETRRMLKRSKASMPSSIPAVIYQERKRLYSL